MSDNNISQFISVNFDDYNPRNVGFMANDESDKALVKSYKTYINLILEIINWIENFLLYNVIE